LIAINHNYVLLLATTTTSQYLDLSLNSETILTVITA